MKRSAKSSKGVLPEKWKLAIPSCSTLKLYPTTLMIKGSKESSKLGTMLVRDIQMPYSCHFSSCLILMILSIVSLTIFLKRRVNWGCLHLFFEPRPYIWSVLDTIKQKCELALTPNLGICSQFLKLQTLQRKVNDQRNADPARNQVVGNIVRKINVKAGGVNAKIGSSSALWKKYTSKDNPTLFLGADVTHPSPAETDIPSIAAVVGNIDLDGVR